MDPLDAALSYARAATASPLSPLVPSSTDPGSQQELAQPCRDPSYLCTLPEAPPGVRGPGLLDRAEVVHARLYQPHSP